MIVSQATITQPAHFATSIKIFLIFVMRIEIFYYEGTTKLSIKKNITKTAANAGSGLSTSAICFMKGGLAFHIKASNRKAGAGR